MAVCTCDGGGYHGPFGVNGFKNGVGGSGHAKAGWVGLGGSPSGFRRGYGLTTRLNVPPKALMPLPLPTGRVRR